MLTVAPLLLVPVAGYAALAIGLGGGLDDPFAASRLSAPLFQIPSRFGEPWPVSPTDLVLGAGLVFVFLELIRGFDDRMLAATHHVLSVMLLLVCLAAMIFKPAFDTSAFLLLTFMVLLVTVTTVSVTLVEGRHA